MPGLNTTADELTADEIAELWETPADSQILKDSEAIYSALQSNAPEVLIPIGVAHVCQSAVIQSTDTKTMSATFTILTRPKKTELNRGGRMVQIAPGPLGQGMRIENYQNNPVVLFNHGMEGFVFPLGLSAKDPNDPVGTSTMKFNARQMSGTVYFSQKCPYAESIYGMVDDKLIRMSSAGFNVEAMIPLEVDTSKLPQGVQFNNKYGYDCTQSDLIEWSVVVAGADAGALRQCCETGKYKGHVIRPQLIPVLRQYAERPQAWGVGFGDGIIQQTTIAEKPSIAITGDIERFEAGMAASVKALAELTQQISTLATNFATQSTQVTTPSTQPAENPVQPQKQVVVQPQPVVQQIDFAAIGQQIGQSVSSAVAAAMKPTQDAQKKLADRIDQLTGKLPD